MREVASTVIDLAVQRGACDFIEDIAARIPLYMICSMMGVPRADWKRLFTLSRQAFGGGDAITRRFAHLEVGAEPRLSRRKTADLPCSEAAGPCGRSIRLHHRRSRGAGAGRRTLHPFGDARSRNRSTARTRR